MLLDAAWAIPVALSQPSRRSCSSGEHGAAPADASTSRRSRRLMAARVLAVTGICLALSSALSVGIYEFLVWKETH